MVGMGLLLAMKIPSFTKKQKKDYIKRGNKTGISRLTRIFPESYTYTQRKIEITPILKKRYR